MTHIVSGERGVVERISRVVVALEQLATVVEHLVQHDAEAPHVLLDVRHARSADLVLRNDLQRSSPKARFHESDEKD